MTPSIREVTDLVQFGDQDKMTISLTRLSVFGLLLHLIFFYSIFDIYFSSPLVRDLEPMPSEGMVETMSTVKKIVGLSPYQMVA